MEETACYVCLNVFAERGIEPNDIALPIPAGSLCFMWRVFQLKDAIYGIRRWNTACIPSKRCNLCLEEKLNILKEKDNCLLNKRSEIISACQHKNRFQVKSPKQRKECMLF